MTAARALLALILAGLLLAAPAGPAPAPVTTAAADRPKVCTDTVGVVSANVRFTPLMAQPLVRADVRRMATSARTRGASAYLGAEIHSRRYKRAWRAALPGYRHAGIRTENPVSVDVAAGWRVVSVRIRPMMDGIRHVAPDLSTTVVRAVSPAGFRVAYVATHMISRAWTHREASTPMRRALWRSHHRRTAAIVRWQHRSGWTVLIGGDFNHPRNVHWHRGQRMLANAGLMQLAVVPAADVAARASRLRPVPASQLHTDHPIVTARLRLAGLCP